MKVNDSKNISSSGKTKKKSGTGKASGASFESMVDAARGADKAEATAKASKVQGVDSIDANESRTPSGVPQDAKGRGNYMLEQLEELEKEILTGRATDAVERLKNALDTQAIDIDQISPRLKEILDEIDMRASVEVAKIEEANKKI